MLLIYTSLGKQDKVQIPQVDTKINNVLYFGKIMHFNVYWHKLEKEYCST